MLKFKYDDPEGYMGNQMYWSMLTEADEKYTNMFFEGGNLPDSDTVPLKLYYERLVVYPDFDFKSCLELNCGGAERVLMARQERMKNVFGCDDEDLSDYWEEIGVVPYCRIVDTSSLPYADNSFDFIIAELRKYGNNSVKIIDVLDEVFRVGCGHVYICGQYSEHLPVSWWINIAIARGLLIEVQNTLYPDGVCIEGTIRWAWKS